VLLVVPISKGEKVTSQLDDQVFKSTPLVVGVDESPWQRRYRQRGKSPSRARGMNAHQKFGNEFHDFANNDNPVFRQLFLSHGFAPPLVFHSNNFDKSESQDVKAAKSCVHAFNSRAAAATTSENRCYPVIHGASHNLGKQVGCVTD